MFRGECSPAAAFSASRVRSWPAVISASSWLTPVVCPGRFPAVGGKATEVLALLCEYNAGLANKEARYDAEGKRKERHDPATNRKRRKMVLGSMGLHVDQYGAC